jgi:hypothetical protein
MRNPIILLSHSDILVIVNNPDRKSLVAYCFTFSNFIFRKLDVEQLAWLTFT